MDAGVLVGGQGGVAGDHGRLGDRRDARQSQPGRHEPLVHDAAGAGIARAVGARELAVLLVERKLAPHQTLVLKRTSQDARVRDRAAVVGEPHRPRIVKLGHLGQLHPLHPARDTGQEARRHRRLLGGPLAKRAHVGRGVDRRLGVGHRQHPAVASGGRRAGARLDVLLVLVSGRPQVDVRIEESGEDGPALRIDQLAVAGLHASRLGELGDPATAHDDVVHSVQSSARVEHAGTAEHQLPGRLAARAAPVEGGDGADGVAHAGSLIGVGAETSSASPPRASPGRGRPPARSS